MASPHSGALKKAKKIGRLAKSLVKHEKEGVRSAKKGKH